LDGLNLSLLLNSHSVYLTEFLRKLSNHMLQDGRRNYLLTATQNCLPSGEIFSLVVHNADLFDSLFIDYTQDPKCDMSSLEEISVNYLQTWYNRFTYKKARTELWMVLPASEAYPGPFIPIKETMPKFIKVFISIINVIEVLVNATHSGR